MKIIDFIIFSLIVLIITVIITVAVFVSAIAAISFLIYCVADELKNNKLERDYDNLLIYGKIIKKWADKK